MPRFGPYIFKYNPPITLFFDSDEHQYLREFGEELVPQPSVTQLLKIIDKSEFLIPWAAKRVVEKVTATWPLISDGFDDYTKPLPVEEFQTLLDAAKKAPREILEDAGNVGEEAHRALENAIQFAIRTNGGVVEKLVSQVKDPRAQSCCDAALDWMDRHEVLWLSTERKIYSREYEFAGTMDGTAFVSHCRDPICCPVRFVNAKSIIDWKSSNQLSANYGAQVAAYNQAHVEETGEGIFGAFILRLGKEDGEFEPWPLTSEDLANDFQTFLACLELTACYERTKDRMAAAKKARTTRKRLAKKVEEW